MGMGIKLLNIMGMGWEWEWRGWEWECLFYMGIPVTHDFAYFVSSSIIPSRNFLRQII